MDCTTTNLTSISPHWTLTLTVSWNHKCDVAPRSYSTLNGVLVPLTLSRTLRSQPLKNQLFFSCYNSALLPQPTLKSRLLLDEVKLDLVEPDHIKPDLIQPHFTRLKSNRSLRSGHFFVLTIFLAGKSTADKIKIKMLWFWYLNPS